MKFDLEKSIERWLRGFRKHSSFDDASIREMELHLRDHIEDLLAEGKEEKEAFSLATKEFGEIHGVAEEEKSNLYTKQSFPFYGLARNNLKIGIRNITKRPFYAFLNTFGLSIGIAGALLISLFIYDELSFDKMFEDAHLIHRINIDNQTNGEYSEYASAPGPMAGVLVEDCPAVDLVTRFRIVESALIRRPEAEMNVNATNVVAVDSNFFNMFGIQLLEGNPDDALRMPNTLILTESAVNVYFSENRSSVIGQSLILNDESHYMISGVIKDLPKNSFLRNHDIFLALSSFDDANTKAWNTWYFPTFVKLHRQSNVSDLQAFLNTVKEGYLIPWAMTFIPGLTIEKSRAAEEETGNFMRFNSIPLTDIRLYSSDRRGEFSANSDVQNIYIMAVIGCMLLVLASVNFMNLTTAYSLKRIREVGIRKSLGSTRSGLIRQFMSEALLISFSSMVVGLITATLLLPFFNELADKNISIPFNSPLFWFGLVFWTLILGILSGSYPAAFMSKIDVVNALKGEHGKGKGNSVRNSLVVFQFAISVFLIVCTLVVYQQVSFMQTKDLGYEKSQVLIVDNVQAAGKNIESLRNAVQQLTQVDHVSLSSYLPTPSERNGTTYFVEGQMESGDFQSNEAMIIQQWEVDHEYVGALGLELISGRTHETGRPADNHALIINETTARMMGYTPDEVLGQRITDDFHRPDKENMEYFTIIGVVEDFHFESLKNKINGLTLKLGGNPEKMIVRVSGGNYQEIVDQIGRIWEEQIVSQPFSYYFLDQSFDDTYRAETRLGSVFMTFTTLSIFIACLGLFGLATFNAERRTKEIGIRKVLGASIPGITMLLSINFVKLVLVSIVIAIPLSWYVMEEWLQDFTYRTELNWWIFLISGGLAVLIALLTVGYQSIRSAIMNPVNSIRTE